MRPTTKTKTTEATRTANTKRAEELFAAGQRIVEGESPTRKESLQVQPAAAPKPFLPSTVEGIAAAIADMLTYGGTPEDQERIILAAISQEARGKSYRRAYGDMEEMVRRDQSRQLPGMLKDLADFRIERPNFDEDDAPSTHIVEVIRQNSRLQCAQEFKTFLEDGSPEEIRFLANVLNCQSTNGSHRHELAIATAFFDEIDRDIEIFRVPAEHSAAVDAYIDALTKAKPEVAS